MKRIHSMTADCYYCPRHCIADRKKGIGFCRENNTLRLAWAGLHFGEEPPITGKGGSGAVFITGCNLHCIFCQNKQISHQKMGETVSQKDFVKICLELQRIGAENINIVTGSHDVSFLLSALKEARSSGLTIPICWNSSGFDSINAIDALSEYVDIWLPDLKTVDSAFSSAFFNAPQYPQIAMAAITRMTELSPFKMDFSKDYPLGKLYSGVLIRHLVLPGHLQDTEKFLSWFDEHLRGSAELSIMTQYTPVDFQFPNLPQQTFLFENRFLTPEEESELLDILEKHHYRHGYCQELNQNDEWLPDFNRKEPFSSNLAKGIWHWKYLWLSHN